MQLQVYETRAQLGEKAAAAGADVIRKEIAELGHASIVLATGASQLETLQQLVAEPDIDWSRVTAFHLDEYIGVGEEHPASFRRYLSERFAAHLPPLEAFHYVDGTAADPEAECGRLTALIAAHDICVAFIGIGENGHLAFNDPPADFDTEQPFIVVELDDACRRQQLGEGWFESLDAVPRRAISMSIKQIMKCRTLIVSVPDERKAEAVAGAVQGPVSNSCPASMLQHHPDARLFLDRPAAAFH